MYSSLEGNLVVIMNILGTHTVPGSLVKVMFLCLRTPEITPFSTKMAYFLVSLQIYSSSAITQIDETASMWYISWQE